MKKDRSGRVSNPLSFPIAITGRCPDRKDAFLKKQARWKPRLFY
jgi:hypothetical protein